MAEEKQLHWADEKEAIKSNKPLKFLLFLFKYFPKPFVRFWIFPVAFFFMRHNERIKPESLLYQQNLREYTKNESPKVVSPYRQIVSFCLCILEKMEGWLGLMKFNRVQYCDDDVKELIEQLKQGKGALLINSHIGNMELLRSLSEHNTELVGHDVPVLVIMEVNPNEQFTNTLKEVNPKFALNVVDSSNIGPDTICYLMEEVDKGALIIIAGDRTSAHARDKFIVHNFLGKPAPFPYGTFLIPFLMKCPVYYMFGLRKKFSIVNPVYKVYIEKSKIDFNCPRNKREEGINNLCLEFIEKLEKFCRMYPYQWYNFFNFWNMEPEKK